MTAGSLLERLRSRGEAALEGVKFVVVDEVHERSSENDLLLACLRQMMLYGSRRRNSPEGRTMAAVHLVLMSATFDRDKYRDYFSRVPDAGTNVVSIPSAGLLASLRLGSNGNGNNGSLGGGAASPQPPAVATEQLFLEQAVWVLERVDPSGDPRGDRDRFLLRHPRHAVMTDDEAERSGWGRGAGNSSSRRAGASTSAISGTLLELAADLVMAQCWELLTTRESPPESDRREGEAAAAAGGGGEGGGGGGGGGESRTFGANELGILVFLPTYKHIEQLSVILDERKSPFVSRLHQRHSSSSTTSGSGSGGRGATAEAREPSQRLLLEACEDVEVTVLHSSVDVESVTSALHRLDPQPPSPQAAAAASSAAAASASCSSSPPPSQRRKPPTPPRRVFLATPIAESSVTIPSLAVVVDLCRTNRVAWDPSRRAPCAAVEWASRDSLAQRRGRTGRTCRGACFALVPAAFAARQLPQFEPPALGRAALRDEALLSLCSRSKATAHPFTLFANCLDPPSVARVQDALDVLVAVGAASRNASSSQPGSSSSSSAASSSSSSSSASYSPTPLGRLLDAFPVSLDAGRLALACAKHGLLREGAALAAILSNTPRPLEPTFRDPRSFQRRLERFYGSLGNAPAATARDVAFAAGAFSFADAAAAAASGSGYAAVPPDVVLEAQLGAFLAHSQWRNFRRAVDPSKIAPASAGDGASASAASASASSAAGGGAAASGGGSASPPPPPPPSPLLDEGAWCVGAQVSRLALTSVRQTAAQVEAALVDDDANPCALTVLDRALGRDRRRRRRARQRRQRQRALGLAEEDAVDEDEDEEQGGSG